MPTTPAPGAHRLCLLLHRRRHQRLEHRAQQHELLYKRHERRWSGRCRSRTPRAPCTPSRSWRTPSTTLAADDFDAVAMYSGTSLVAEYDSIHQSSPTPPGGARAHHPGRRPSPPTRPRRPRPAPMTRARQPRSRPLSSRPPPQPWPPARRAFRERRQLLREHGHQKPL